ncbi:MAG TPA: tRNA1(Val) (adenine(37)-N6)-methyltransferase [Pseudobacteroides sp.]|nr:tRNA1(Val) (adenine(37)-N6)-methyltransferase [Pseudobacteroides sp.]
MPDFIDVWKRYGYKVDIFLNDNEVIDDLQYKGLRIIQKNDGFKFGIDAVILSHFVDVKKNDNVIDLGTGTGIIPILLAGKTEAKSITGLEIQSDMAEMANRSVLLNSLEERVKIVCGDIKECVELFGRSKFNVVVTNPPYMSVGRGLVNPSDTKSIARHEILCTLEDIIRVSSKLLVPGGQFAMVHRPQRLVDILFLMRQYKIEPKFLRFVHPSPYKRANLILVKGSRGGNPELKMMEPLYVYDENGKYSGKYSKEIDDIYHRGEYQVE